MVAFPSTARDSVCIRKGLYSAAIALAEGEHVAVFFQSAITNESFINIAALLSSVRSQT